MRIAILSMLVTMAWQSFAQQIESPLRMEKTFLGGRFYQDGRELKPRQVLKVMAVDSEALEAFRKAKANYDAAQAFGYVSGFLIGWPLGTGIAGGDPQWGMAAAGVGVLLLSIPLSNAFTRHAATAVEIYNNGSAISRRNHLSVSVIPYGTGAKVVLRL